MKLSMAALQGPDLLVQTLLGTQVQNKEIKIKKVRDYVESLGGSKSIFDDVILRLRSFNILLIDESEDVI